MLATEYEDMIQSGGMDDRFSELYPGANIEDVRLRYVRALRSFASLYGDRDAAVFSVPGRSEILGNHTDHNNGCVLAAAVNLDVIAVASVNCGDTGDYVRVKSEGFEPDFVDIRDLEPKSGELYTSTALVRGVCAGMKKAGFAIGGFDAFTTSVVLKGSGLSSSAAFEILIGHIISHFFNEGKIAPVEKARVGQYAENEYFGKPCGLMDQVACSLGGLVAIDFENPKNPEVRKHSVDLKNAGYNLCIVNTRGSHDSLSDEYAAISEEMKSVAEQMGKTVLREVTEGDFYEALPELRRKCGDRAVLRAKHYFDENRRVKMVSDHLSKSADIQPLLGAITESGESSYKLLQNLYVGTSSREQEMALAVVISEKLLAEYIAGVRVHGGGFAGTILAVIPDEAIGAYKAYMNKLFGDGAVIVLSVRSAGACTL